MQTATSPLYIHHTLIPKLGPPSWPQEILRSVRGQCACQISWLSILLESSPVLVFSQPFRRDHLPRPLFLHQQAENSTAHKKASQIIPGHSGFSSLCSFSTVRSSSFFRPWHLEGSAMQWFGEQLTAPAAWFKACCIIQVRPESDHLTPLCLTFPFRKRELTMPSSWCCYEG